MAIPDGNILTNLLKDITAITAASRPHLQGYAVKVFVTLTTIDIIIASLIMLMEDEPLGRALLRRTLKYGAFAFMVLFYKDIINAFSSSFVMIGLKAAGDTLSVQDFTNPSKISTMGFDMIGPVTHNIIAGGFSGKFSEIAEHSGLNATGQSIFGSIGQSIDMIKSLPSMILVGLVCLMILFCFFIIAINIFVVYVEFAIFTSIALILVPFGVWEKTEFIFDKVKHGVINFGIKYMTLSFIVSTTFNIIKEWQLPTDPTFQQALYMLLGMMAVTYLCWHAPSVAAGMASGGGGTMTAAALAGAGASMATGAASAGSATGSAGKMTAGVAGAATKTAARKAHRTLSALSPNLYGGIADQLSTVAGQIKTVGNPRAQKVTPPPRTSGVRLDGQLNTNENEPQ